jgi:putative glycerol-1-phosphate prenyltransferase
MGLYSEIQKKTALGEKMFAVLIDPDKHTPATLKKIRGLAIKAGANLFLFGGSLLTRDILDEYLGILKSENPLPVVLFPGNNLQISNKADGILFLSLISGRNAEMLIGRHVVAAPYVKASKLEAIPTGYMLVDGGSATTVSYMSNTFPIPADKPAIAACTALAGEMLGLRLIYLDAGSGAKRPVSPAMIREVKRTVNVPLVIGGGITTPAAARRAASAGADIIVVGNVLEKDPALVSAISKAIHN